MTEWWRLRCDVCGRFIDKPYDVSTAWGGPTDLEPPDDEYWCRACFDQQVAQMVERPWRAPGPWWRKPWAWQVASAIRRHRRRHPEPMEAS